MMLSLACGLVLRVLVFHLSQCELTVVGSMLWFVQGFVRWRWLSHSGMWLVLLESAKDRFLGVDPPE
jgi:hypothetical protein